MAFEFAVSDAPIVHTREGAGRTADPHVTEVREQMRAGIAVSEQNINSKGRGATVQFDLPKSKELTKPREYESKRADGTTVTKTTQGGQDAELMLVQRLLRECAEDLGRGLSIQVVDKNARTWTVRFETKVPRQTKENGS